jgi:hypothetical protein
MNNFELVGNLVFNKHFDFITVQIGIIFFTRNIFIIFIEVSEQIKIRAGTKVGERTF